MAGSLTVTVPDRRRIMLEAVADIAGIECIALGQSKQPYVEQVGPKKMCAGEGPRPVGLFPDHDAGGADLTDCALRIG